MSEGEKLTVTQAQWRETYAPQKCYRIVEDLGDGNLAIEFDTRTKWDNTPMTMSSRKTFYKERVKRDDDMTFLSRGRYPKELDQQTYEEDIYKVGRDRRKQYLGEPENLEKSWMETREGKYDEYEY